MATPEDQAAQSYFEATGDWPEGYTQPGQETDEERQKRAAQDYYNATGHWPGEKPAQAKQEEAPEDAFSHYLTLGDGSTVRWAAHPKNPGEPIPTVWNGVPVVKVHNSHSPTQGE